MRETKKIVLMAFLMAIQIVISFIFLPVGENLKIYFTFIIVMIAAIIFNGYEVLIYAVIEDNIAFFLYPQGAYFFGYTISAVLGIMIYHLFLHDKVNIKRICLAKILVNLFVNVLLGSLWSMILYSKGYLYYLASSLVKNTLMLPLEIIIFIVIYKLIGPLLYKEGLIKKSQLLQSKNDQPQ